MAIIKCPECGHQVSDKAPTCPSCGVEIYGNIIRCPQCGGFYLKESETCPICHHANVQKPVKRQMATPPPIPNQQTIPTAPKNEVPSKKKNGKKHWAALGFAFLLATVVCGICFYFYHQAKDTKENEAYTYAITSNDPLVLQSFLDTYRDASTSRRDSIQNRLSAIQQEALDWDNACKSQSKTQLLQYLDKYPESLHKGEAMNTIDSIDWAAAKAGNTIDAFANYQAEHPNGKYFEDANEEIKKLNAQILTVEEETIISELFHYFFQAINNRNDEQIKQYLPDILKNFQGRSNASPKDVIAFSNSLWKSDVANVTWKSLNDYQIGKEQIGDDQYEFDVTFTAAIKKEYYSGKPDTTTKYLIAAHVNEHMKVVEFNASRIIE